MRITCALVIVASLAGCTAYHPKPVDPVQTESAFRDRKLSDPGLLLYMRRHSTSLATRRGEPESWDLTRLTLASFYYHPDLVIARAQLATALAGITTAGARPNPTVSVSPGWESVSPPFLFNAALDLPIETAGKRERRIEQAQALGDAARIHIEEVTWEIRSAVRSALVEHLINRQEAMNLRTEVEARDAAVALLQQRLAAGSVSQPELDLARIESANATLALRSAEGRGAETLASLATTIGVPASALDGITLEWSALEQFPPPSALAPPLIHRAGLLNRADVRRTLAEYAASEGELRLQVAKQYPDLQISPGYAFDQGTNKFTVGIAMTLPIFDQNQGPIAEAQAKREEVAGQFIALQAKAIGQTDLALAHYQGAMETLTEADRGLALSNQHEASVQRSFDAGQADRLALVGAHIEVSIAARARLDTLRNAQSALGALEDAIQQPLGPDSASGDAIPPATSPSRGHIP